MGSADVFRRGRHAYRLVQEKGGWTLWEDNRQLFLLQDDADAVIVAGSLMKGLNLINRMTRLDGGTLEVSGGQCEGTAPATRGLYKSRSA